MPTTTLQRFQGLEMMPQQLWETTMNPETHLKQVEIQDAAEADRIFTILMGGVAPRRNFETMVPVSTSPNSIFNLGAV